MPAYRWVLIVCLVWLTGLFSACRFSWREIDLPVDMVKVPAGWFWMGDAQGPAASRPGHWVYLEAFAIDRTEVTEQEFAKYIETSGLRAIPPRAGEGMPAVGVIWKDAQAYCRWVGKRLPSEAEWEKAARGVDGRRFPWGNDWQPGMANTAESRLGRVAPLGSHPEGASPYGVLDMSGNAAEWVADYYSPTYYSWLPAYKPKGQDVILDHGLRGGSWDSTTEEATTFFRDSSHSVMPNLRVGFRCAQSLGD